MSRLENIVEFLGGSAAIGDKLKIRNAYSPALEAAQGAAKLGDDCAAMPDPSGGFLLLAAEGLLQSFVADDPWFAGYSAVMVNISDICAMGGRPLAVADVLWTPDHETARPVWEGMTAAARDYGVPIVGGHTTLTREPGPVFLAASIVGKANVLLTSFDARPGDELLMVVDLNARYRGDKPFWNASVGRPPERLRENIELLPRIAESGWCQAAKDISNGGVIGTLLMLLECSRVGAALDLGALPMPPDVEMEKWLISFPSFGYLLSVPAENRDRVIGLFDSHQLCCKVVGRIKADEELELQLDGESSVFWRQESRVEKHA